MFENEMLRTTSGPKTEEGDRIMYNEELHKFFSS
jgi:hypothetical protein